MSRSHPPGARADLDLWDAQFEVFKTMTPPLRPHESEVAIMQRLLEGQAAKVGRRRFDALLLGLTPEYVGLQWPAESRVAVVDRSRHVVEAWWPGDVPGRREIILADWLDMPFGQAEFDLILGDGVFNFMPYPAGFQQFAAVLSQFLRPGGRLAVRVFVQPETAEQPADLLEEYRRSERIDYFGFRFRLAQSIQERPEEGLFLNKETLDNYLIGRGIDLQELYEKSGHTPPGLPPLPNQTADSFRVSYPTEKQFCEQIGGSLEIRGRHFGAHPLARRTPIFAAVCKD